MLNTRVLDTQIDLTVPGAKGCRHVLASTIIAAACSSLNPFMSVGHSSGGDYPAGQAWQQWSQVRPSAQHAGIMHQSQVLPAQAMYPVQPVYAGGMAMPQYGYMPQQAIYHQGLGAYAGNGSEYSGRGSGSAYVPSTRDYQQSQAQLDYNCQVKSAFSPICWSSQPKVAVLSLD